MKKIVVTILISVLSVFASQPIKLDMKKTVSMAIENNEDILTAEKELEKSEYRYDEAFSGALPRIDAKITYLRNLYSSEITNMSYALTGLGNQVTNINNYIASTDPNYPGKEIPLKPMPEKDVEFMKDNSLSWEINLIQPIWLGGKVGTAVEIAEIYEKLSQESYKLSKDQVALKIMKLYNSVLLAKEAYKVMKIIKSDANKNLENIENMFNNGLVSEYDFVKAKSRVLALDPKVLDFENRFILAKNSLKSEIGLDFDRAIELTGSLKNGSNPEVDENFKELVEKNRREIKLMEYKISILDENVKIKRSGYYPNILAIGNYTFKSQNDDFGDTFEKNYGVNAISVGLTANWSIFSGGETSAKVDQAQVDMKKARLELQKTIRLLKLQAQQNMQNVKLGIREVESQEEYLKEAKKALAIANTRFNNDLGTQLEVIDAQTKLEQARLNYIKAEYNLRNYNLDYLYSIGKIKL
ncbi:MAG: hypothetical protein CSA15_12815 [Candidatus Delongbacteria bacterium]|nr:MAG: hypothetical protein CSA15_12815 [Candidatus Delongbacteria bacterium]